MSSCILCCNGSFVVACRSLMLAQAKHWLAMILRRVTTNKCGTPCFELKSPNQLDFVFLCSKWKADRAAVTSLCVSPDGKLLLSAGQVIKMWDLDTKEVYRVSLLFIHLISIHICCFIRLSSVYLGFCVNKLEATLKEPVLSNEKFHSSFKRSTTAVMCKILSDFSSRIDRTVLLFVIVLSAEVHRPLHSCDDPALCHHAASRQQRSLFPVWCCTRSPPQCLVSAHVTSRAHIRLLVMHCRSCALLLIATHVFMELTWHRLSVGKCEKMERTRIRWCPSRWQTSRNTSTSSRLTARKRSVEKCLRL